jgi:glucose-1-phosphate thymidylyltransferase
MRAIIPVAGVGTRLRPHTYTLPKVLLNVAGKPILGHILDTLIEQGVTKATIITGYMRKLVEDYVRSRYDIDVEFIPQKDSLGLGVKTVEDPRRFGVVVTNRNGHIDRFEEKPETPISNRAIVGLYYIKDPMNLRSALEEIIDKDIKTRGEYQLTDALQLMLEKGEKFTVFPVHGWYDCGKPETLLSTNQYLLDQLPDIKAPKGCVIVPPVYIAPDATIERSVIGPHTTVASGASVRDSVVGNSSEINYK